MAALPPVIFASPVILAAAVLLSAAAVVAAIVRRVALPRLGAIALAAGMLCLCLAAGGMTWRREHAGTVAVVVDTSPSTRTARFHDPAALRGRLDQLLGRTRYTLYGMADRTTELAPLSLDKPITETSCRQTVYDPPPADAVVLFSDGQFAPPPAAPRTYPVIDPSLNRPPDSRVERIEMRRDGRVAATVTNARGVRTVGMSNATPATQPVEEGRFVVTARPVPGAGDVWATLGTRDPWPENNGLNLRLPPPPQRQRWWVGARGPGGAWRHITPAELTTDPPRYLAAAAIVLDNVAADDLTRGQQEMLERYVRELGGGLVILGGDRAFAAGGYAGSALERLSPLASTPPRPATHWVLLADSSGSMSATVGDNTRWAFAANALARLIPLLPPQDVLSVGNFAQTVHWWRGGRPVRELQASLAIPRDIRPTGPTNLGPALRILAEQAEPALPTQLLLITDAEAKIDDPVALAAELTAARVRVSVLTTADLSADNPVRRVVERTGGQIIAQDDPRRWATDLRQLFRRASPDLLVREPLDVTFTDAGPALPGVRVAPWNRTWTKPTATELARGRTSGGAGGAGAGGGSDASPPAIAAWNVGAGAAIAAAFEASPQLAALLADRVAVPPRDPRFTVTWDAGEQLAVTLDAVDNGRYLNELSPRVELSTPGASAKASARLALVAPGRYRAAVAAPERGAFATVSVAGQMVEQFAVPGRYAPEFAAIGNDRAALARLAQSTGGEVIEPDRAAPIDFHWPRRDVPLAPYLAAGGAALTALGLIRWRLG